MNAIKLFMLCLGVLAAADEDACVADTYGNCVSGVASNTLTEQVLQGSQLIQMKNMLQKKEPQRHHESVKEDEDKSVNDKPVEGKDKEQEDPAELSPPPALMELGVAIASLAGTDQVHQDVGRLMSKLENMYWEHGEEQDLRPDMKKITDELKEKIKSGEVKDGQVALADEQVSNVIEKLAKVEELMGTMGKPGTQGKTEQNRDQAMSHKKMLLMELGLLKMRQDFIKSGVISQAHHSLPQDHNADQKQVIKLMDKEIASLIQKINLIQL